MGVLAGLMVLPAVRGEEPTPGPPAPGPAGEPAAGDPGAAPTAIEAGRGGSLRDAILARDRRREVALPERLEQERVAAQDDLRAAQAALQAAVQGSDLREVRRARVRLGAVQARVADVAERIRRYVRDALRSTPSPPVSLAGIQAALRSGEVLVAYGTTGSRWVALVLTREGSRVVDLGATAACEDAAEALAGLLDAPATAASAGGVEEAARQVLVDPLQLGEDTRAVILSLEGVLHRAPVEMLLSVPCWRVASGSVLVALRQRAPTERGEGVLAFGDPAVETATGPASPLRCGTRALPPLPATRQEVEAIGDVVHVGVEATETRLRAAFGERRRWRAVHLAAHGLLDVERPMLTAIALAPDLANDGFLLTLEIHRLVVDADLVVLSADGMAGGRIVPGEGVAGPVSAFLAAGARAVLAPLRKVDDAATAHLMQAFYRHWNPREATAAEPAPVALREAQREVAAQTRWASPYHWAGWVLEGDPD